MSSGILKTIANGFKKKAEELNDVKYGKEAISFTIEGLQEIGLRSIIYQDVAEILENSASIIEKGK